MLLNARITRAAGRRRRSIEGHGRRARQRLDVIGRKRSGQRRHILFPPFRIGHLHMSNQIGRRHRGLGMKECSASAADGERDGSDDDGFFEHDASLPIISERIISHPRRALQAAARKLAKYLDEAIDIRLVVINMRADAQAAEARGDENVLGGELRHQPMRHAVRKAQAQNVRRPHARVRNVHARSRKPSARRAVSMASRSTIAARPHCAIISMPMAAISMEMK